MWCVFQKKVVKDNATLLEIVETPTKDIFLKVNITWTKIQVTPLPQEVNMTRVRRPSSTKAKHLPYPWENMTTLEIGMYLHKQKISKVLNSKTKVRKKRNQGTSLSIGGRITWPSIRLTAGSPL